MVIEDTAKFSANVIAPLNEIGDSEGCTYVDQHTIKTPSGFKAAYDQYNEGGWQGLVSHCACVKLTISGGETGRCFVYSAINFVCSVIKRSQDLL